MINNINQYSSLLNNNPLSSNNSAKVDEIIAAHTASTPTNTVDQSTNNASLFLSSRSQKINALSNEFFSQKSLTLNDVSALKTRAYELGLISKAEYAQLTETEMSDEDIATSALNTGQSFAHFIGSFLERLSNSTSANDSSSDDTQEESETLVALKDALIAAQVILEDVEEAKTNSNFKDTLANSLSFLKETINADAFELMPLDDKVGLSKVYQALEIVDKITPQRLSNDKLNRYMEVAFK